MGALLVSNTQILSKEIGGVKFSAVAAKAVDAAAPQDPKYARVKN